MTARILTLTTDFGTRDSYVAEMKGSVLSAWERLRPGHHPPVLVDVTHEVPRHDVSAAARILGSLASAFPPGTVHLAVIDPGVGSTRRPIAVASGGHSYVGPDNGLFTAALGAPDARTVQLDPALRLLPPHRSRVFDGRDLFAPAAAALLSGEPVASLGAPVTDAFVLATPPAVYDERQARGVVTWIDAFGNARTSLEAGRIPPRARIRAGEGADLRIVGTYAELEAGEAGGLASSDGSLELAIREGDAARFLHLAQGDEVIATW